MSVTGSASSTNNLKVLKGKIASLSPYAVDQTFSVSGSAADAKAVGDALKKKLDKTAIADNLTTNDSDMVLSAKQGATLKKSVDNLKVNTEQSIENIEQTLTNIGVSLEGVQNSAESAQNSAENAQASAEKKIDPDGSVSMTNDFNMGGHSVVNLAEPVEETDAVNKGYVDSRTVYFEVTLSKSDWATTTGEAPYTQTIKVPGILAEDKPHYGVVYSSSVETAKEEKGAFGLVDDLETEDDNVTFTCFEERPDVTLAIQMEVNR